MLDPSILVDAVSSPIVVGVPDDALTDQSDRANHQGDSLANARRDCVNAQRHAQILAATIEIQSELDLSLDFDATAVEAVRRLAFALPHHRIQIAWRQSPATPCRLIADSEAIETASKEWIAAAEEISHRGGVTVFPPQDHASRHANLAIAAWVNSIAATAITGVPLTDSSGNQHGALIAIPQHQVSPDADTTVAQFQAIAVGLANRLSSLQSMRPHALESFVRNLTSRANQQRRRLCVAALVAVTAVLMMPVPYRIAATCELQPVQRRMVAAPVDGPLKSVAVRPGDVVRLGDTLATIDPREIDFQLASLDAEVSQALQQKKAYMAEHDFGAREIATLEARRLQLDHDLLKHRRDNLEIRSPVAGMVISGDLKPVVGSPLSKGDSLFEIAPLDQMILEVAVSEQDYTHVQKGMPVTIRLDALASKSFSATIDHVHPSGELRDGNNVFIADARIENHDGTLRPGMRGRVKITGERHALGWNLFHRAYHAVLATLGW